MLARARKALVAGVAAGITALVSAAVQNGSITLGGAQLSVAIGAAVAAAIATWSVPNAGPKPSAGVTGEYVGGK